MATLSCNMSNTCQPCVTNTSALSLDQLFPQESFMSCPTWKAKVETRYN